LHKLNALMPSLDLDDDVVNHYFRDAYLAQNIFKEMSAEVKPQRVSLAAEMKQTMLNLGLTRYCTSRNTDLDDIYYIGTRGQIEKLFHPVGHNTLVKKDGKYHCASTSPTRVFAHRVWPHILAIPFFSAPGQFYGAWMAGTAKRGLQQPFFRKFSVNTVAPTGLALAYNPRILDKSFYSSRPLVFVQEPDIYLRLQCKHTNYSNQPLEIAAWHLDHAPNISNCSAAFWRRNKVFWTKEITGELIAMCSTLDARIATNGPLAGASENDYRVWLRDVAPADWVKAAIGHAKPWHNVLNSWLYTAEDSQVETLLVQFNKVGFDVDRLQDYITADNMERLQQFNYFAQAHSKVKLKTPANGISNGRRLLTNFNILVKKLLIDKEQQITWVVGEFSRNGVIVDFCKTLKELSANLHTIAQHALWDAGCKDAIQANNGKQALQIAIDQSKPLVIKANSILGWNDELKAFCFPRYQLTADGKEHNNHTMTSTAAVNFKPGLEIAASELDMIAKQNMTCRAVWPILRSVITNAVRSYQGLPLRDLFVVGIPRRDVEQIAALAGCNIRNSKLAHNWPVLHGAAREASLYVEDKLAFHPGGIFIGTEKQGQYVLVRGDCDVIFATVRPNLSEDMLNIYAKVVPCFLRWFFEKGLAAELDITKPRLYGRALRMWLQEKLCNKPKIKCVRSYSSRIFTCDRQKGNAWVLGLALAEALEKAKVHIVPWQHRHRLKKEVLQKHDQVFVSFALLHDLTNLPETKWAFEELDYNLKKTGVVTAEETIDNYKGWWIPLEWVKSHLTLSLTRYRNAVSRRRV